MKRGMTLSKILLTIALILFIRWDVREEKISNANFEDVFSAVLTNAELPVDMHEADRRMVKRFYGLNANDYENCVLYSPGSNMDAHELLLIQMKDLSQRDTVESAIQKRLSTQKKSFDGYGAEQTKMLNDCVLKIKGNYVLFLVCDDAAKAGTAFVEAL